MKLTVALTMVIGTLVLACSTAAPAPAEPTPNIDATVEAKVAQERAVDATVQAKVSGTLSASEAKTPSTTQAACKLTGGETVESGWTGEDTGNNSCNSCFCTNGVLGCTKMACPAHQVNSDSKPVRTTQVTPTSKPSLTTNTPEPTPTDTPTLVPTATAVPTPTLSATPTPKPTPSPSPTPTLEPTSQSTTLGPYPPFPWGAITVSPYIVSPNSVVVIVGSRFTPNSFIEAGLDDCRFSGITIGGTCGEETHLRTTVDTDGTFALLYTIPNNAFTNLPGCCLEIRIVDSGGGFGAVDIEIGSVITATPTPTPKPSVSTSFGNGTWIVGSDIKAGTYRSSKTNSGCYWERLSGFSGELDDIVANGVTDAIWVVEIASTDAGFSTERCGTWTEATSAVTSSLTGPFGDGVFLVGMDVSPGIWKSSGGDYCYWARLSGFSGELGHIKANGVGGSNNILTIEAADKGFESSNCGTWTKTG